MSAIVRRIFEEYLSGRGLYAIAEGLTADGVPCPSAADPARNRHRSGIAWSKGAIRAILRNPRYTGRQVWNRQSRDEQLIDVEDVAMGHKTRQIWNDQANWIWSAEQAQEAVVDVETFTRAQQIAGAGAGRPAKKVSRRRNPYLLRGLILCSSCGRRMQGSWNHDQAHYRCKLPSEYALANKVDHPPTIYVKESAVVPALDEWIASVFDPSNLEATCEAVAAAQGPVDQDVARAEAAVRRLADCDERLGKYRAALDAGADATVVAGWMAEVQAEKLRAEQELVRSKPADAFDAEAIRALVEQLGPMEAVLAEASSRGEGRAVQLPGPGADLRRWPEARQSRGRSGVLRIVSEGGFEPPRPCGHQPLKLARLPVPPLRRGCASVAFRAGPGALATAGAGRGPWW